MSEQGVNVAATETENVFKMFTPETKALRNGDVEAYVSTESIDRMGDIIKAKGWELDAYKKSGSPVLFGHDQEKHIGNAVEMEIQRKGLWSVTRFHEKTQLSREAAILAREKLMPAWSVGFRPTEKPEDRMIDGKFMGFIFTKQELLEYSLVAVPAQPDAVSKGAEERIRKAIYLANKGLISRATAALVAGPSALPDTDGAEDAQSDLVKHFRARVMESCIREGLK